MKLSWPVRTRAELQLRTYCHRRVLRHAVRQVNGVEIRGLSAVSVERRVPWRPTSPAEEWTRLPIAEFRFDLESTKESFLTATVTAACLSAIMRSLSSRCSTWPNSVAYGAELGRLADFLRASELDSAMRLMVSRRASQRAATLAIARAARSKCSGRTE